MNDVRFPYKPKTLVFLLSIILFAGGAVGFGNVALANDRGLILNGIIEFSTQGATILYWCLATASGLFVVFGAIGLYSGLTTKKEIVLTENEIISPKSGISNKVISVLFSQITEVDMQSVQGQRFLRIRHQRGKLTIAQSMLANKQAFEELTSLVEARVSN